VASGGRADLYTQDVFRTLTEPERTLADEMTVTTTVLAPNRAVVNQGEVGVGLFLITGGWAYRYRRAADGSRQILDFLLPGELVGLQAALLGMIDHSVSSLTMLHLRVMDARLVGEVFRHHPGFAVRLARHMLAEARRVDQLMTVIGCGDARRRLGFLMLALYQRQRQRNRVDPGDCPFPLRRQHIADALGLTGAHVNRTLNRLEREGVVTLRDSRLAIHDLARLGEIAGVVPRTDAAAAG
jgi:CRP/FNR family transcriptional regulator